jgi:hypothetical protein
MEIFSSEQIKLTHQQAELQRLDDGMDGCGCPECQELYKTIDLEKYGARVHRFHDVVLIAAGAKVSHAKSNDKDTPETPAPPLPKQLDLDKSVVPDTKGKPVKPPYHRHGQSTIYDPYIDKAIAAGGSLRSIKSALLEQGIAVSHMTISRRIARKDTN